jgi:hypothetical protein
MLLVAVFSPCVLLLCISGEGVVPSSLVDRRDPPRFGFGGPVWPFAASELVFLGHLVSWVLGPPSVLPCIFRVVVLPVCRLYQQDGDVGFFLLGIVMSRGRAYMLPEVH